jgi:hypothetical protein
MTNVQRMYTDMFTTCLQGQQMAAFPPLLITGGHLKTKHKGLRPGDVIEATEGAEFQVFPVTFNAGIFPQLMQVVDGIGDSLTGLNAIGTGQALEGKQTATEIDAMTEAMSEIKDSYAASAAIAVAQIYDVLLMMLKRHYTDLKKAYGDVIEVSYEELQDLRIRMEVTGKSGGSSPSAVLKKLGAVLMFAKENPGIGINPEKVVRMMLGALDLPFSIEAVMYTPAEKVAAAMGANPAEIAGAATLNELQANGPQNGTTGPGNGGGEAVLGDAQGGELADSPELQPAY